MEAKELIDRYIHEVGRHLPKKLRGDVTVELRSLLEETFEERAAGRALDEEIVVEALREFGKPDEVAQRYGPSTHYLVGPEYYPAFIVTMRVVLTVLSALFIFGILAGLWSSENVLADLGQILIESVPQFIGYAFTNLGLMALIFTVIERLNAGRAPESSTWDPRSLPAVEDPDRITKSDIVATICFHAAAMLVFNIYPDWISYLFIHDGQWGSVPLLAQKFFEHLPWLNICWLLEIGIHLLVLRQGRWQRATRWAQFGNSLFGLVVLYRMMVGGPLLTMPIASTFLNVILALVLVIAVIEAVVQLYRLLTRERNESPFKNLIQSA